MASQKKNTFRAPHDIMHKGRVIKRGELISSKYKKSFANASGITNSNGSGKSNPRSTDSAAGIDAAAPNFGRFAMPHIQTFQGLITSAAHTYRNPDEAIKHCRENALKMRRDCFVMECIEARQRGVAMLNWHIEPENNRDPAQKEIADLITGIMNQIPRFTEMRRSLLEAVWAGRHAVQTRYGQVKRMGKKYWGVVDWKPIHGDKLAFRYDDGTGEFDENQIGIRVTGAHMKDDILQGTRKLESTEWGLAYFLEPWERDLVVVHKHMIEDAAFEDYISSGSIHGVGIRSRIYWTWLQMAECMAFLLEYIERTGQGIWIYYYPSGNEVARQEVENTAERSTRSNVILMPRMSGDAASDPFGIERIDPSPQGAENLKTVIHEFFGHRIKRYVLGQTLSTESDAAGMGSGLADLHYNSYLEIVKYDATNLEETITQEIVRQIKEKNFPEWADYHFKFKIDTESAEKEKKLASFRQAYDMGARIREADVMDAIGVGAPQDGDVVLQNPTIRQQERLWQQQMQQDGMGGMGGDPNGGIPPGDPNNPNGGGGFGGPSTGPNGEDLHDLFGPLVSVAQGGGAQFGQPGQPQQGPQNGPVKYAKTGERKPATTTPDTGTPTTKEQGNSNPNPAPAGAAPAGASAPPGSNAPTAGGGATAAAPPSLPKPPQLPGANASGAGAGSGPAGTNDAPGGTAEIGAAAKPAAATVQKMTNKNRPHADDLPSSPPAASPANVAAANNKSGDGTAPTAAPKANAAPKEFGHRDHVEWYDPQRKSMIRGQTWKHPDGRVSAQGNYNHPTEGRIPVQIGDVKKAKAQHLSAQSMGLKEGSTVHYPGMSKSDKPYIVKKVNEDGTVDVDSRDGRMMTVQPSSLVGTDEDMSVDRTPKDEAVNPREQGATPSTPTPNSNAGMAPTPAPNQAQAPAQGQPQTQGQGQQNQSQAAQGNNPAAQQPPGGQQSQPTEPPVVWQQPEFKQQQPQRQKFVTQHFQQAVKANAMPKSVGGMFRAMMASPDFSSNAEYSTHDFAPQQAQAVHQELSAQAGREYGGGYVCDLSATHGAGAIGFSSPAGAMVLTPPSQPGGKWLTHYSANTGVVQRAMSGEPALPQAMSAEPQQTAPYAMADTSKPPVMASKEVMAARTDTDPAAEKPGLVDRALDKIVDTGTAAQSGLKSAAVKAVPAAVQGATTAATAIAKMAGATIAGAISGGGKGLPKPKTAGRNLNQEIGDLMNQGDDQEPAAEPEQPEPVDSKSLRAKHESMLQEWIQKDKAGGLTKEQDQEYRSKLSALRSQIANAKSAEKDKAEETKAATPPAAKPTKPKSAKEIQAELKALAAESDDNFRRTGKTLDGREFHTLTRDEFASETGLPATEHKQWIKDAIERGDDIPAEVLKKYPELVNSANRKRERETALTETAKARAEKTKAAPAGATTPGTGGRKQTAAERKEREPYVTFLKNQGGMSEEDLAGMDLAALKTKREEVTKANQEKLRNMESARKQKEVGEIQAKETAARHRRNSTAAQLPEDVREKIDTLAKSLAGGEYKEDDHDKYIKSDAAHAERVAEALANYAQKTGADAKEIDRIVNNANMDKNRRLTLLDKVAHEIKQAQLRRDGDAVKELAEPGLDNEGKIDKFAKDNGVNPKDLRSAINEVRKTVVGKKPNRHDAETMERALKLMQEQSEPIENYKESDDFWDSFGDDTPPENFQPGPAAEREPGADEEEDEPAAEEKPTPTKKKKSERADEPLPFRKSLDSAARIKYMRENRPDLFAI